MSVLSGLKVIELGGMGPGPFCGMMLADMGADVVIIDRRIDDGTDPALDIVNRGKRSIRLDLKTMEDRDIYLRMVRVCDVIIDPFRPGVADRLGIGPDVCLASNLRLIYGQMTGWGQHGPLSQTAGRDLNYIAITGALDSIGTTDTPIPPINLIGDYSGALYLLAGLLAAYTHALKTGCGQVVDAAMCDSATSMMTATHAYYRQGLWKTERGQNFLDGSAPDYGVYRCADGRFIAFAAMEPQALALARQHLGLSQEELLGSSDPARHEKLRAQLSAAFLTRTRDEWSAVFEATDCCVAPVLNIEEAIRHPHLQARRTFIDIDGVSQPAPAPRFSKTPSSVKQGAPKPGGNAIELMRDWLSS